MYIHAALRALQVLYFAAAERVGSVTFWLCARNLPLHAMQIDTKHTHTSSKQHLSSPTMHDARDDQVNERKILFQCVQGVKKG